MKLIRFKNFNLEKLYLDCIDEEGNCFIIYEAKLNFSFFRFYYSAFIFSNQQNETFEKSVKKKFLPAQITNNLIYKNSFLQISGNWEKVNNSIQVSLYKDENGNELTWNCHHPNADTKIIFNGKCFSGRGYAETLSLNIKPWNLPIDELRWGRFLSKDYTIIWINWKGKFPINRLYCNGILYEDAIFEFDKVIFDKGRFELHFLEMLTIRNGKLSGVLAKMKWLKSIINSRILKSNEIKFKSITNLTRESKQIEKGWSLFEMVTWEK